MLNQPEECDKFLWDAVTLCYFQALDTVNKNKIFKLFTTNNNFHTQLSHRDLNSWRCFKLPYFYVYFIDEINFVNSIFHYIKCKLLNCKVAKRAYEVLPPAHCRLTGRLADRHYFQFSISITLGHTLLFPTLIFISDPEDRGTKFIKGSAD